MVFAVPVDEIHEGCQGGGFARAHRPGDQHQSVLIAGERQDVFERQTDVLDGADLAIDDPEGHVIPEALFDDRGAVAAVRRGVSKVDVALAFEAGPLGVAEERTHEAGGVLRRQYLVIAPDGREFAEAAPGRWVGGGQVEVGAIVVAAELQVLIDMVENLMG